MPRILFIGDIHVKAFLLPFFDAIINNTEPDHVICVGDYMDDWGISSSTNLEAVQRVFVWARSHGNVTLLFGNHDMAYYSGSGNCSGNDYTIRGQAHRLFEENLDILQVAYSCENWLFTHAGLCQLWAQQSLNNPTTAHDATNQINELLTSREGLQQLEAIGRRRGGYQKPSPLWTDWSELAEDYYFGINQIVGHTPQKTCSEIVTATEEHLWNCDTFSISSNGTMHSDGSMLLLDSETNTVAVIKQTDQPALSRAYKEYAADPFR